MNDMIDRRSFIATTALAGAALATLPVRAAEDTVTLAFVGCAHIHTPGFINLLRGRKDVKVKAVWDHDSVRAAKRAADLGAKAVANPEEIWADPEIRAVIICSETNRHHELIAAAARAGKHMFAEKPLGITARESAASAKTIERAGLLFTTGYFMRTDPKHLFLREQVAKSAFGRITRIAAWNCHNGALGGWFDDKPNDPANNWRWMADPKVAGVGGFGDLGTHSLDILMWLLGEIESVAADLRVVTGRYGKCDENGQALIKFKSGVMGTLTAGWVDVANPVTFMISGTEGNAVIVHDRLFFKAKGYNDDKPVTQLPAAPPLPMDQFVNAVEGKPDQPLVKPSEAAARVAVMEAMYKSARVGKWEDVG
ncbi:MAG: Gfo/Idh/MocA family oxidoreductase [Verrucomicrobiota bacterium]|jgi:predicted dehydrogenase